MNYLLLLIVLLLAGCEPASEDYCQEEGEGVVRSLVQKLQLIRTREQLFSATDSLTYSFDQLVDIMIASHEHRIQHHLKASKEPQDLDRELSEELRFELNRLYQIECGRQVIEKCQESALNRLDMYEKRQKMRSSPNEGYGF